MTEQQSMELNHFVLRSCSSRSLQCPYLYKVSLPWHSVPSTLTQCPYPFHSVPTLTLCITSGALDRTLDRTTEDWM